MQGRSLVGILALSGFALALTGCTPPWTGVTGIARTADGRLSAVVIMCEGQVDGVTIHRAGTNDRSQTVGKWEYDAPVLDTGDVVLEPDPQLQLVNGARYSVYSWSRDSSAYAYGTDFALSDLVKLRPRDVLSNDYRVDRGGAVAMSAGDFAESAEAFCEAKNPGPLD